MLGVEEVPLGTVSGAFNTIANKVLLDLNGMVSAV